MDPLKPRISCQDVPIAKGFDMTNRPKPRIRPVCYWLKCCIGAQVFKNEEFRKDSALPCLGPINDLSCERLTPNLAFSVRFNLDCGILLPVRHTYLIMITLTTPVLA